MKADPAAQHRLVELQQLDTKIARAEHAKKVLPELEELKGLKSKRDQLTDALIAADTARLDAADDLKRAEEDLVPVRQRLEADQKRVDAGQGDPKALQATISEIEHLHRRISVLEDTQLEAMEAAETTAAEYARIKAEHDGLTQQGRELVASRNKKLAELDAEIANLQTLRAPVAASIPADLMARYDKLRARLGTGVGELKDRRTTCCGLEANSADLARYTSAAPDEVILCEECGRILVRP